MIKDTVVVETNKGDRFQGKLCSDVIQLISQEMECLMILIRSTCGLRAGFFSLKSNRLFAISNLIVIGRTELGLQGLRSPTLFLDCVSATLSTCMWNQQCCFRRLPHILRNEGVEIVMNPLFQNGLRFEYKRRLAADILAVDYHLTDIESSFTDPSVPAVLDRTVKKVMQGSMDTTVMACGLQLEMDLDAIRPNSDLLTIKDVDDFITSEANSIDILMFEVVKMPRLLSSRNPNRPTIYSFYHILLLLLSYHSNTPITSETSSCMFRDVQSCIAIMEPLYIHANRLLQWLNDKRMRSEKTWNDLNTVKEGLIQLIIHIEPAGLPIEEVSCVRNEYI